jgi:hypothetical protein
VVRTLVNFISASTEHPDAYTYLGLTSSNEYSIKASLYSSADLLKPKEEKKDQKLEGFFYNKKKDNGDWR